MKSRSRKDDACARILRAHGRPEELDRILQDECRRRASRKLAATLSSAPGFRFPTRLSAEQCTSDAVAAFHASLIAPGSRVVDLTAGLGIDVFHVARRAAGIECMDIDPDVAAALTANAAALGLDNVEARCCDCRDWLAANAGKKQFDVAFIDPARRSETGGRLFSLTQCHPDVIGLLRPIRDIAPRLLVKVSPMLDITQLVRELGSVRTVYAVGTAGECKELLADVVFGHTAPAEVVAVTDSGQWTMSERATVTYAAGLEAGDTLGEPWAAVAKALSAGELAGERLAPSTMLYRNPDPATFPGNIYRVERVVPFSSSALRQLKREGVVASVAARNFPLRADELRRRLGAQESAMMRLMATTLADGMQILAFLTPDVKKNA